MNQANFIIKGADGKDIIADMTSPETEKVNPPLVIFVHGFKGFKDWGTHHLTADFFAQNGFRFLKFNFSHDGISDGKDFFDDLNAFSKNTPSRQLFDLDQVITFAMSGREFPAPDKLFLIGHSLGGGISIVQTAEDKRVDKLVTWASISNFRKLWSIEQEESWRKNGILYIKNTRTNQQMPLDIELLEDLNHHSERLDVLNAARAIEKPWLIVHGGSDAGVPPEHAHELNRQQELAELLLVAEGDHVFGAAHPWTNKNLPATLKKVCEATIRFLKK